MQLFYVLIGNVCFLSMCNTFFWRNICLSFINKESGFLECYIIGIRGGWFIRHRFVNFSVLWCAPCVWTLPVLDFYNGYLLFVHRNGWQEWSRNPWWFGSYGSCDRQENQAWQNQHGVVDEFRGLGMFQRNNLSTFKGRYDLEGTQSLLNDIEKIFQVIACTDA